MRVGNYERTTAFILVLAVTVGAGCSSKPDADVDASTMNAGLEALYTRHDATAAAAEFRKVLERNPTHYGATFQLATALDAAGRPDEARPLWEKMAAMADRVGDRETADKARAHLATYAAPSEEALMQLGLDALYKRRDAAEAITQFRKVLDRNPAHYGATYQLASALDAAGKRAEAQPLWEKMLQMAEAAHDAKTADTARSRLQANP